MRRGTWQSSRKNVELGWQFSQRVLFLGKRPMRRLGTDSNTFHQSCSSEQDTTFSSNLRESPLVNSEDVYLIHFDTLIYVRFTPESGHSERSQIRPVLSLVIFEITKIPLRPSKAYSGDPGVPRPRSPFHIKPPHIKMLCHHLTTFSP